MRAFRPAGGPGFESAISWRRRPADAHSPQPPFRPVGSRTHPGAQRGRGGQLSPANGGVLHRRLCDLSAGCPRHRPDHRWGPGAGRQRDSGAGGQGRRRSDVCSRRTPGHPAFPQNSSESRSCSMRRNPPSWCRRKPCRWRSAAETTRSEAGSRTSCGAIWRCSIPTSSPRSFGCFARGSLPVAFPSMKSPPSSRCTPGRSFAA